MSLPVNAPVPPPAPRTTVAAKVNAGGTASQTANASKFSFRDLIDIVNPLQHIPIVGTIYREITGDEIKNTSRIVGGALFGGIVGAAIGAVNAVAVDATGDDVGQLAMHKMGLGKHEAVAPNIESVPPVQLAQNDKAIAADQNGIVWDAPSIAMLEAKPSRGTEKSTTEKGSNGAASAVDNTPLITVTPPAMPAAKELSSLPPTPEQADAARVASVPKDLGKDMLTALSKYEAMQKLNKTPTPQDVRVALNAGEKRPAEFVSKLRRYN